MSKSGATSTRGSKNVFADLGFSPAEAENLRVRSALMGEVREFIRANQLTQVEAAKLFGVTQPRVSDLMRGKIDLFSIDMLIGMLATAGVRVEFSLKQAA